MTLNANRDRGHCGASLAPVVLKPSMAGSHAESRFSDWSAPISHAPRDSLFPAAERGIAGQPPKRQGASSVARVPIAEKIGDMIEKMRRRKCSSRYNTPSDSIDARCGLLLIGTLGATPLTRRVRSPYFVALPLHGRVD